MQTKPMLTLDDAKRIAAAAEAEARTNNWAVVIAVCDDGGHLILLHRIDGVAPISSVIGPAKARAAALGKRETKLYEDMINQGRAAFLSAPLDGMLEGGVPIIDETGATPSIRCSRIRCPPSSQTAITTAQLFVRASASAAAAIRFASSSVSIGFVFISAPCSRRQLPRSM